MRTERQTVVVYLGLHKTASTYFQRTLNKNRKSLNENGVDFIGPKQLRGKFTRGIQRLALKPSVDLKKITALREVLLSKMHQDFQRIIISNENIASGPKYILHKNEFYGRAKGQMLVLKNVLQDFNIEFFFALRDLQNFLPSLYCEILLHHEFQTFREFLGTQNLEAKSWIGFIHCITEVFDTSPVTIWDYNNTRELTGAIIENLVGYKVNENFKQINRIVRPTFSGKAIEILSMLSKTLEKEDLKKIMPAIRDTFPKNSGYGNFDPFTVDEREYLQNQYEKDWDEITALPMVKILGDYPGDTE